MRFTPKDITKGLNVIREMKSLEVIGIGHEDKDKFPADEFWKKYDAGEFGKPGFANQPWNTPAFQAWTKAVQAMSAEEQVKAVSKKLVELNPGFDGKVTDYWGKNPPKMEDGVVTELGLLTDNVTDIVPVARFMKLKTLKCESMRQAKIIFPTYRH